MTKHNLTIEDRFWSKVDKGSADGCWEWTGNKHKFGYGTISIDGRPRATHRVSWEIHNGNIPEGTGYHGTCICHKCDNPSCVRPEHLFLGSVQENNNDMVKKGRRSSQKGANNPRSKINSTQARVIRRHANRNLMTHKEIGSIFSISSSSVAGIKSLRRWAHV